MLMSFTVYYNKTVLHKQTNITICKASDSLMRVRM